ncbi:serine/threonine protein kinase [Hyalangium gracile]|uniref:serine/threonine protein kinase n=1 Tax=Hyalangium gracile TaxID=394092 RepID=UPI001CCD1FCB|nr:serine/threonine-protein kinase [Hyalangium gracile]
MQHPFHLMPDMLVGPFRIQARLGAGGFGAVFRVESGGQVFALKFAVHGPDSEDLNRTDARARRELACLLLITHPNVVRVWGHGRWPDPRAGYHYVVMDYVEGPTLLEWVKQARPTLRQVVRAFDTLALALDALHAEGIHHRDLKGSNILVRARDGEPVLVDFGAAEHTSLGAPLTEGPLPPGTPHLRTPEAVRFHREQYADPNARYPFQPSDDLYALGCTLYEVLTSAPPFPPTLPREVLTSLIEKEMPASPAVLNPQVPVALAQLVLRLLAKRPEERPASGRALHEQFQALLHDDAPTLDMVLSPGANAATTEGMGGPAVMSSVDDPERPLSGPTDWGGAHASPEPTAQREDRAPTAPAERASPGSPPPGRRRWVMGASAGVLLAVLAVVLWGSRERTVPASGAPASGASASTSEAPADADASEPSATAPLEKPSPSLPTPSSSGDAGTPDIASLSPDAGSPALAEALPPSTQPKGSTMRTKPPAKPSPVPPEPEKPRSSGSSTAGPLAVAAACAIVGGCTATEPAVRPGPPPRQLCPPGAVEAMAEKFHIGRFPLRGWYEQFRMPGATKDMEWEDSVVAPEGRHEITLLVGQREPIPKGLVLVGDFFIRDRVYARFVEARLPNGERVPFCGQLEDLIGNDLGAPFLPGSEPGAPKVRAIHKIRAVFHDH